MNVESYARAVMEWADILGGYSEEPDRLTRRFATSVMLSEEICASAH